jgi:hypothetical protein
LDYFCAVNVDTTTTKFMMRAMGVTVADLETIV